MIGNLYTTRRPAMLLVHSNVSATFHARAQSCPTPSNPLDCSPPGSSVHGILQARTLEWAAISCSREPYRHRGWTCISRTRWILYCRATWEAPFSYVYWTQNWALRCRVKYHQILCCVFFPAVLYYLTAMTHKYCLKKKKKRWSVYLNTLPQHFTQVTL